MGSGEGCGGQRCSPRHRAGRPERCTRRAPQPMGARSQPRPHSHWPLPTPSGRAGFKGTAVTAAPRFGAPLGRARLPRISGFRGAAGARVASLVLRACLSPRGCNSAVLCLWEPFNKNCAVTAEKNLQHSTINHKSRPSFGSAWLSSLNSVMFNNYKINTNNL